jgi:hypothetical protein
MSFIVETTEVAQAEAEAAYLRLLAFDPDFRAAGWKDCRAPSPPWRCSRAATSG